MNKFEIHNSGRFTLDHDFCLGWSQCTDTDRTSKKMAAAAGIEPRTSGEETRALPTGLPRPSIVPARRLNRIEVLINLCREVDNFLLERENERV